MDCLSDRLTECVTHARLLFIYAHYITDPHIGHPDSFMSLVENLRQGLLAKNKEIVSERWPEAKTCCQMGRQN